MKQFLVKVVRHYNGGSRAPEEYLRLVSAIDYEQAKRMLEFEYKTQVTYINCYNLNLEL